MKKHFIVGLLIILMLVGLNSCESPSATASYNLSQDADHFRIMRRVVFYNGITDKYILSIEGFCSVDFRTDKFIVTVKTGPNQFKKHYLGKADNVFPFVEQLDSANVSEYHYKVILRPSTIIPIIELDIP